MKKLKFPIGDYRKPDDLADKIDWEGGLAEFILHYSAPGFFKGTHLEQDEIDLRAAYKRIEEALYEAGALL